MTSEAPGSVRLVRSLILALTTLACGTGHLDPFEPIPRVAVPPPDHSSERCVGVDTDETKSFIPAELESVTAVTESLVAGEFQVDWTPYPLPYLDTRQWAIWGKGVIASNGRHYSAVGDGESAGDDTPRDGNTVLYEYDPATRRLRAVGDVLTAFGLHVPGENGYAKIQGQIQEGPCGLFYMHSYWGSPRFVTYVGNYQGDLLLTFNPWTKDLRSLGVKVPRMGVPATALFRPRALLYGEASTPTEPRETIFWAYDIAGDSLIFQSPRRQVTDKHVAVDHDGHAYYSGLGPSLYRYDPATNSEILLDAAFDGGGTLRASTRVALDGTILMMTVDPPEVYRFDPGASTLTLLASLARPGSDIELDPTERVAYFVPVGLDGLLAFELYELDRATGSVRSLIDLGAAIAAVGSTRPRGSYSVNVTPDGSTLYIAANAGEPDGYGSPVFLAVRLPGFGPGP
jgi:hypothetical protein